MYPLFFGFSFIYGIGWSKKLGTTFNNRVSPKGVSVKPETRITDTLNNHFIKIENCSVDGVTSIIIKPYF